MPPYKASKRRGMGQDGVLHMRTRRRGRPAALSSQPSSNIANFQAQQGSQSLDIGLACSLSENTTTVDSVVERGDIMNVDAITSLATESSESINIVSHRTTDAGIVDPAPANGLDLASAQLQEDIRPASKSDGKQKDRKIDLATLMKEGNIVFAAAMAKLNGKIVDTLPIAGTTSESTVYLEDLHRRSIESLPKVCSVTDVTLQDELLQDDYPGLPPLAQGQLKSWSNRPGVGTTCFSGWTTMCPDLEFIRAINAIWFDVDGHYVNPSRVDPTILSARDTSGKCTRFIAEIKVNGNWETAVFTTPIRVLDSRLHTPDNEQKFISGAAHRQEWERMAAVFCMIMGESVLNAQVVGSELRFSTKLVAGSKYTTTSSNVMVNTSPSPASIPMTSNTTLTKAKKLNGRSSNFVHSVLEAFDTVPVFDARDHTCAFEFKASSLSKLEASLPLYTDEIPLGSLAEVAYTATYFIKTGDRAWSLSVNLQWIIILGSPL